MSCTSSLVGKLSLQVYYTLGDLKQHANAVLYGEPTGAKPSHFGDIRNFNLPNSKLNIVYSTKYFDLGTNSDTLMLDVEVVTDIDSYLKGIDPVVEKS